MKAKFIIWILIIRIIFDDRYIYFEDNTSNIMNNRIDGDDDEEKTIDDDDVSRGQSNHLITLRQFIEQYYLFIFYSCIWLFINYSNFDIWIALYINY